MIFPQNNQDADIKMAQYDAEARDKQWQEEKAEVSIHSTLDRSANGL
jgi:hypothetical protein